MDLTLMGKDSDSQRYRINIYLRENPFIF